MKSFTKLFLIMFFVIISTANIFSQDNTSGIKFYFILHPGQVQPDEIVAEVFIHSKFETDVLVEKGGQIIRENIRTKENDYISFSLTAEEVQGLTAYNEKPVEGRYENKAIRITVVGDEYATCFVRTKYGYMSDGTGIFDVSKAGYNYQISNPAKSKFVENTPANYTAVIGLYDDTRITFRMGGCESCTAMREDGGLLLPFQTLRRTLNEGDVYYVPAYGYNSVLTGSTVKASKPVLAYSGSNMAFGNDVGYNYTINQELPEDTWGKSYMIPQLFGSPHEPTITIFAKYPNTKFNYNDKFGATITTPGGIINTGYYQGIAKDMINPEIPTVEVTADSNISVIMTDPNVTYNNNQVLPFQMQILPTEHFSTTALVKIKDHQTDFINIVYKATIDGEIPNDMKISEVIDGKIQWEQLSQYSPDKGLRYVKTSDDGGHYRTKNIKFNKAGTYHFKSNQAFGVYQYGYSESGAYGFPINGNMYSTNVVDTLPPYVSYVGSCWYIEGEVIDEPRTDSENRSNLAMVYMKTDNSYNYRFTYAPFVVGVDLKINWKLEVANDRLDAMAHLVFVDKAGNRKDTIIKCPSIYPTITKFDSKLGTINLNKGAINRKITGEISSFSDMKISNNLELYLILDSDSTEQKAGDINTYQNFDIVGLRGVNLYPSLADNKIINAEISFKSSELGRFRDSLGFVIIQKNPFKLLHWVYVEELSALVGDNYAQAEDFEFESTELTFQKGKKMRVSNPNNGQSETSLDLKIHNIKLVGQNLGFNGSGKTFEVSLPQDITEENPLIIKPNEFYDYDVKFEPQQVMDYNVAIVFEADADKPKNTSHIKGKGLTTSVAEQQKLSSNIEIQSENGTLKFYSQENYYLDELEIYDLSGKLLSKFKVEKELNGYTIETSIITKGVYIVNCRVNGLWFSKKVIN